MPNRLWRTPSSRWGWDMSDDTKRIIILLTMLFVIFVLTAIVAPCDGSCSVAEEVRRG